MAQGPARTAASRRPERLDQRRRRLLEAGLMHLSVVARPEALTVRATAGRPGRVSGGGPVLLQRGSPTRTVW